MDSYCNFVANTLSWEANKTVDGAGKSLLAHVKLVFERNSETRHDEMAAQRKSLPRRPKIGEFSLFFPLKKSMDTFQKKREEDT